MRLKIKKIKIMYIVYLFNTINNKIRQLKSPFSKTVTRKKMPLQQIPFNFLDLVPDGK